MPLDMEVKSEDATPQGRLHTKHFSSHSPGSQGTQGVRFFCHIRVTEGLRLEEPLEPI